MKSYHLNDTINKLQGPPKEQIIVQNYWAATALDKFHAGSSVQMEFSIDGVVSSANLNWDSNFSKSVMKEDKDIANHGGVALAWFVMSVLLDYQCVEQSEIGDGVDYRFMKSPSSDDELNFMVEDHFVEVSGILTESSTNTLNGRVKKKHEQITRGRKKLQSSSVIVTLFSQPRTVKEVHK